MKMGIDARFFGPKTGGGIGRYVSELVGHLQQLPFEYDVELFLQHANFHQCTVRSKRFTKQMADIPWYTIKEQLQMPPLLRRSGVQLMHYPHWNVPRFSRIPFVVTIHDLILLEQQNSARTTTKSALVHAVKTSGFRVILEHAVHKSKAIIALTEHGKEQILRYFDVPKEKIHVIPNGVTTPVEPKALSLVSLGIYQPYFLTAGNAYPHKNLELVIDALALVRAVKPFAQVVIAGKRDVFSHRLEEYARGQGLSAESVRFVDHPDDDVLAHLYASAHAFVFPSKLEGFGIPPLEALQHSTPVIASNLRPMTDILGESAHYIDPDDPTDLARAMLAHLANPAALRARLASKETTLGKYSWATAAQHTKAIYDHTLSHL